MQKIIHFFIAAAMLWSGALHAQDIIGNWQGTLQVGKGLRTILKISKEDGYLKAVIYSIDQGPGPLPVSAIALNGNAVTLSIKTINVTDAGTLSPDGKSIIGSASKTAKSTCSILTA